MSSWRVETELLDTRYGKMEIPREAGWIGESFRVLGEWSENEVQTLRWVMGLLQSEFPEGLDVVDAGAYVGDMTVPLALVARKVWAFEPQPSIREVLARNVERLGLRNVEIMPFGLGHKNAKATFKPNPDAPGSVELLPEGYASEATEIRTLDSLGINPHLVKADVEGMELHLIYGAQETLRRASSVLFFEHGTAGSKANGDKVEDVLRGLWYVIAQKFVLPVYQEGNWRGVENPFPGDYCSLMSLGVPMFGRVGRAMWKGLQEQFNKQLGGLND